MKKQHMILTCTLFAIILGITTTIFFFKISPLPFTPQYKVINNLAKNKESFVLISEYLQQVPDNISITKDNYKKIYNDTRIYKTLNDLFEEKICISIEKSETGIFFYLYTSLRNTQGVVYKLGKNLYTDVPSNRYITDIKKIEENWYYFKEK